MEIGFGFSRSSVPEVDGDEANERRATRSFAVETRCANDATEDAAEVFPLHVEVHRRWREGGEPKSGASSFLHTSANENALVVVRDVARKPWGRKQTRAAASSVRLIPTERMPFDRASLVRLDPSLARSRMTKGTISIEPTCYSVTAEATSCTDTY
jgi:hypothetical protein